MKLEYESPLSGKKDNLFDVNSLVAKILGVVITFIVIAAGQNLANKISSKIPAVDTTIDPLVTAKPVVSNGRTKISV